MQINPSIFKAYDIRGIYPKDLNEETVYRVGRAAVLLTHAKTVVIGRDARVSSDSLVQALTKGILEQGANVVDIGVVTTPMLNFAVAEYKEHEAGIMVTASHNPKEYNGLKLCYENALPIGENTGMVDLKKIAIEGKFGEEKPGKLEKKEVLGAYVKKVLSLVQASNVKPLKVVVDTGNAVGAVPLPEIFKKIPCQLIPLYFELDGNFPNHEANPLKEETLVDLKKKVLEEKADLGVAIDGDADRIGFVDEKGQTVRADLILALIAKKFLREKPGELILYDVRSSRVVREVVERAGGRAEMCRVGHSLIKKQMWDEKALFAGEFSSHFYYRDFYNVESGDLTMLKIIEIISQAGKNFSEIVAPLLVYYHSGEINFEVNDKKGKMEELEKKYGGTVKEISHLDGIRLDFDDWWFNVRPSNTEPLLRLNLEAKTKELMENKKRELTEFLSS
ncbi:phosphomannomutase/phosphoglucomutase [Candidatus Falkowbacteria bacterium]|nr:phosphomannomutase/phosphoglucomutase [Candidatus Falkowbacteria bacterium]